MIKTRQIVLDKLLSSYTEAGEGENILILPGWGCNAGVFKNVQNELAKNYKVFAVDFPGFGKTEEPKEVWGCENYANWIFEFIRKLNITTPIVIGHSFGGRIALVVNSKMQFRKLVLTGSAGIVLKSDLEKREKKSKIGTVKSGLEKVLPKKAFDWVKNKAISIMGSADYKNASPQMREILKKIVNEDLKNFASGIQIPTLLIWGENDKDTPVEAGKELNRLIANSELKIILGSGHYAFIDNQNEFMDLLAKFLKNN